jgi:hypothetical protein
MKPGASARIALIIVLLAVSSAAAFGRTRVYLTGAGAANFASTPSAAEVASTFTTASQPLYWGFGWEVVRNHIGLGGLYTADFQQTAASDWWLDWYGQAIFVSYHLFARRTLLDPFVNVGVGSAGRVYVSSYEYAPMPPDSRLLLSVFPFVSAGLGIDLDGLYAGAKATYLPAISPPPATSFQNVPLGTVQVTLFCGIALGR